MPSAQSEKDIWIIFQSLESFRIAVSVHHIGFILKREEAIGIDS